LAGKPQSNPKQPHVIPSLTPEEIKKMSPEEVKATWHRRFKSLFTIQWPMAPDPDPSAPPDPGRRRKSS